VPTYKLTFAIAFVVCAATSGVSQTSSYSELQAAYLYNFAKYISWPGESAQFTIGVLGSDDVMKTLSQTLKDKKVAGKPLVFKLFAPTDEIDGCQMLFLPEVASGSLPKLVDPALSKNILIVTEEDLIKKGAGISFVVQDDKLRFKLKKKILDDTRLVVSDGLLRLAILQ
jgi:hypothetical protein